MKPAIRILSILGLLAMGYAVFANFTIWLANNPRPSGEDFSRLGSFVSFLCLALPLSLCAGILASIDAGRGRRRGWSGALVLLMLVCMGTSVAAFLSGAGRQRRPAPIISSHGTCCCRECRS